ncbi:hypothetical protein IWX90DRAFT_7382 [Phyllosticta citrichinensis]|uniref:Transmembrane protein n=1 Tax=Phyllosticta citrichinensis TaxID=1130410 RepID=A0ABR1Y617_9PEZI
MRACGFGIGKGAIEGVCLALWTGNGGLRCLTGRSFFGVFVLSCLVFSRLSRILHLLQRLSSWSTFGRRVASINITTNTIESLLNGWLAAVVGWWRCRGNLSMYLYDNALLSLHFDHWHRALAGGRARTGRIKSHLVYRALTSLVRGPVSVVLLLSLSCPLAFDLSLLTVCMY